MSARFMPSHSRNPSSSAADDSLRSPSQERLTPDRFSSVDNGSTMRNFQSPFYVDELPSPVTASGPEKSVKRARIGREQPLRVHWAKFKRRLGPGVAPSSSSIVGSSVEMSESGIPHRDTIDAKKTADSEWAELEFGGPINIPRLIKAQHASDHDRVAPSSAGNAPTSDDIASLQAATLWSPALMLSFTRWPAILGFFRSRFLNEKAEADFQREQWYLRKPLTIWAAVFLILTWFLTVVFVTRTRPWVLFDEIFLFGFQPPFICLTLVFVILDFPRERVAIYQTVIGIATWSWSMWIVLTILLCGNYGNAPHISCGGKDFLGTFYYPYAMQTVAMFGLGLQRFPAMLGALTFFLFCSVTLIPLKATWARHMINFGIYSIFILYLDYSREKSERHVFYLKDKLKSQYQATQKAQINESKAAESKRKLTSYVFHDVRVPLNTALLAVQNLQAQGAAVVKGQELEFNALEGSLSMMSQVLNDVLDFNRMDSGRFESLLRPYPFHQVLRSLFIPIKLATSARQMDFVQDLDPSIDAVARRAAYEALGETQEKILQHLEESAEVDGLVCGDEIRLRQIITNLTSNACKFTPPGGKLTIRTRLIYPTLSDQRSDATTSTAVSEKASYGNSGSEHALSTWHLNEHDKRNLEIIVVRIEVIDTGCGIRQEDVDFSRLFTPFNQTELGRQQGGKGSGLGLALVRQIVKLSGGRLGVKSKVGENSGSTFWVELPLGVGDKVVTVEGIDNMMLPTPATEIMVTRDRPDISPMQAADVASSIAASQVHSPSHRSTHAMHGIMDQAGRVELIVSPSDTSLTVNTLLPDFSSQACGSFQNESDHKTPEPTSRFPRPMHVDIPPGPVFTPNGAPISTPAMPTVSSSVSSSPSSYRVSSSPIKQRHNPMGSTNSVASNKNSRQVFDPVLQVLVVDDDNLTRVLMQRLLTRLGCNVTVAENGELALSMIMGASAPFDVVFLDNQMPVMSGVEAIEKLREQFKRKDFVVGLTGNALLSDQNEYLEAGIDRVLTKPVLERHLIDVLNIADVRRKMLAGSATTS